MVSSALFSAMSRQYLFQTVKVYSFFFTVFSVRVPRCNVFIFVFLLECVWLKEPIKIVFQNAFATRLKNDLFTAKQNKSTTMNSSYRKGHHKKKEKHLQ